MTTYTLEEIFNILNTEKNNMTNLQGLQPNLDSFQQFLGDLTSSSSQVAVWRQIFYTFAYCNYILQSNINDFYNSMDELINNNTIGSLAWLSEKAIEFQINDLLVLDETTGVLGYASVNESLKLVASASAYEYYNQNGVSLGITVKIRGKNSDVLTLEDFNAFKSYMNSIKIAGQKINYINTNPDYLKLLFNIRYNKKFELSYIQNLVESYINSYIKNLEFSSEIRISDIITGLNNITGILDPQFIAAYGSKYNDSYVSFTNTYNTFAGYAIIDPNYTLTDSITYVAIDK